MRIFASDRLSAIMERLGMTEGESIVSPMVTRAIERAQRRVEEQNFSSRKHLLEYDDVMNQQRQVVYGQRNQALNFQDGQELDFIEETIEKLCHQIVLAHTNQSKDGSELNIDEIVTQIKSELGTSLRVIDIKTNGMGPEDFSEIASKQVKEFYQNKFKDIGKENLGRLESFVYLQIIDRAWKNHLQGMDHLRDSVSLRGYGQRDPLQEYKKEAFRLFEAMMGRIMDETVQALLHMEAPKVMAANADMEADEPDEDTLQFRHPSAPPSNAPQPSPRPENQGGAQPSDDGMIYHGSRTSQQEQQEKTAAQTVRRAAPKTGRNDPCPCGSGKKYKKCHGSLEGES